MNTAVAIPPTEEAAELKDGEFTLTDDQQLALDALYNFLLTPTEPVFVLRGFSGCGKSTLVRTLLDRLPGFMQAAKLINPSHTELEVQLTATTNKAAESLRLITGREVATIHSFLGLRPEKNFMTGETVMKIAKNAPIREHFLLAIDEASFLDSPTLELIFKQIRHCKVLFIGDPAQLTPVKSRSTPVFEAKFPGAALTQVVRQAEGNPIIEVSTAFRHTVTTGVWPSFKPDGHHIRHLSRADFDQAIIQEFTRDDWSFQQSKILAWTNATVIRYNEFVRNHAKGDPKFQVGDYAVNNQYLQLNKSSVKTDQMVLITHISDEVEELDVLGKWITMDHVHRAFMPVSLEAKKARLARARKQDQTSAAYTIEQSWVDLRAIYAQTINKSQGSTYGSVFIDLDDVCKCHQGDQIARMLYVAISRAKFHVYLTGDLV